MLLLICLSLSSCISNKKTVYLQDKSADNPVTETNSKTYNVPAYRYLIRPGDVLSVKISGLSAAEYKMHELTGDQPRTTSSQANPFLQGFQVDSAGAVDLPLLGKVVVGGLTLESARNELVSRASRIVPNPVVKLHFLNYYVTVLGEVNSPGVQLLFQSTPTLLNAIGQVNGMTSFADIRAVKVIRTIGDQTKVFNVDLTDQEVLGSENIYVYPNDIIYIRHLKIKKYASNNLPWALPALSTLAVVLTLIVTLRR